MTLDVAAILHATGAEVIQLTGSEAIKGSVTPADLERQVSGVTIDSRSVPADGLFVALPGERVDGHDFVGQALAQGATGCLVSRVTDLEVLVAQAAGVPRRYLFVVPDALQGLQQLAHYWRQKHTARIVGITGSIGKTTTKEIVASMLGSTWPVLKSEANLNTEIGLPLMLLRLSHEHRAAVLEMGMYAAGDIELLCRIAEPEMGVVTAIAPIHLERMGTIERIAREKSTLIAALPPSGLAVLSGDDPWTRAMGHTSGTAPVALVGLAEDCDYRAIDVQPRGLDGVTFTILAEGTSMEIRTRVPGAHTVHAFLAGAAIGRRLGLDWETIREAAQQARLDARQRIVRASENMLLIDDSYNAAPMSVKAALEILRSSPGTRIAVLGDMLELGPGEEGSHREVGAFIGDSMRSGRPVSDWLITRGRRARWMAQAAITGGFPAERVQQVESNREAVEAVRAIAARPALAATVAGSAQGTDEYTAFTALVKGSRGMRMEEVVEGILSHE